MRKDLLRLAVACVSLLALFPFYSSTQTRPAAAQADCQTFPATGPTVCGKFLQYWNSHGGLAQQGYPISGQFQEKSDIDGKTYTVQYFERAEFELHPENQPPYDVLLTLLGSMAAKQRYPDGTPAPPTANVPPNAIFFPQTGMHLWGQFRDYWESHGGLAQQGYPISEQFQEKSDIDGKTYTVQYFERAEFELHPENDPANQVLLSLLGVERFHAKYPNGVPGSSGGTGTATVQAGQWGGEGIVMTVTADGAHIEFSCAHADITQPMTLDANGQFSVMGTYVQEHGGPSFGNDQGRPASFTGSTDGTKMTITVTYTDDNTKVGTWTAGFGSPGKIVKCV